MRRTHSASFLSQQDVLALDSSGTTVAASVMNAVQSERPLIWHSQDGFPVAVCTENTSPSIRQIDNFPVVSPTSICHPLTQPVVFVPVSSQGHTHSMNKGNVCTSPFAFSESPQFCDQTMSLGTNPYFNDPSDINCARNPTMTFSTSADRLPRSDVSDVNASTPSKPTIFFEGPSIVPMMTDEAYPSGIPQQHPAKNVWLHTPLPRQYMFPNSAPGSPTSQMRRCHSTLALVARDCVTPPPRNQVPSGHVTSSPQPRSPASQGFFSSPYRQVLQHTLPHPSQRGPQPQSPQQFLQLPRNHEPTRLARNSDRLICMDVPMLCRPTVVQEPNATLKTNSSHMPVTPSVVPSSVVTYDPYLKRLVECFH
jgi:hypothetical protein